MPIGRMADSNIIELLYSMLCSNATFTLGVQHSYRHWEEGTQKVLEPTC